MAINELKRMKEAGELDAQQTPMDDIINTRRDPLDIYEQAVLFPLPLRKGARVTLKKCLPPTFTVIKIEGNKALCMPKYGTEAIEFDVSDLIRI